MSEWATCIGPSSTWLQESLQGALRYESPLPVQKVVVPTISRAILSGIPLDVSLTAPTGSGKTLCYLLPMLRMITEEKRGMDGTQLRALVLVPTKALGQQVFREVSAIIAGTSIVAVSLCEDEGRSVKSEADVLLRRVAVLASSDSTLATDATEHDGGEETGEDGGAEPSSSHGSCYHYFSKADVVISTPQRLLRHLDTTTGLRIGTLRLLVIDEADQVLSGAFANFVSKVMDRYEEEKQHENEVLQRSVGSVGSAHSRNASYALHKVLCSATLSSRIARISEVRLRNCRYLAVDSHGVEMPSDEGRSVNPNAEVRTLGSTVRTSFALPPSLREHIVFVEDRYRHAVLLKLVSKLVKNPPIITPTDKKTEVLAYPESTRQDGSGRRILIFCSSAEEARVMGHFLQSAGVKGVVEFTTLATESERRYALLSPQATCVVASDALMRGIDMVDVGHVVMYHAPETIAQYVHRAGRTARAMRAGHLHLLLNKTGPSGGLDDGEMAQYKSINQLVTRTEPAQYERHFFMFDKAPAQSKKRPPEPAPSPSPEPTQTKEDASNDTTASDATAVPVQPSVEDKPKKESPSTDSGEYWLSVANKFLEQSQGHLQERWISALRSKATTAATPKDSAVPSSSASPPKQNQPVRTDRRKQPRQGGNSQNNISPAKRSRH